MPTLLTTIIDNLQLAIDVNFACREKIEMARQSAIMVSKMFATSCGVIESGYSTTVSIINQQQLHLDQW